MKTETIGDAMIALIRTVVPLIVGWLLAFVTLPESTSALLELILTATFTAFYYALVRLLSEKWPFFGWLLGYPTNPSYSATAKHGAE